MGEEFSSTISKTSTSKSMSDQVFSSPYFLNSSDSPGTILVSCLLKGENYPTWRRAMINALRAKNKLVFVDGSLPKSKGDGAEVQMWEKCNSMVISWIFNALTLELHDSVAYVDTAQEMWTDLQERFSQGNVPRIHELKREICLAQQKDLSVAAYYTKLKGSWDELATYSTIPLCTCGAMKEIFAEKEKEKVHQFLMGLNDQYGIIRSQILNMEPFPTINKAYALVTKEEKQQTLSTTRAQPLEAAAFIVRQNNDSRGTPRGPYQGSSTYSGDSKPRCEHCDKPGHTKERCFKLVGFPPGWHVKGKSYKGRTTHVSANNTTMVSDPTQPTSGGLTLTKEQYDQLMSLLPSNTNPNVANFVGPHLEETDWSG